MSIKSIIGGFSLIAATLLLVSCLVPYIPVEWAPFLPFLSLTAPFLVIANLFFLLLTLLFRSGVFWLNLAVLIGGYFLLGTFYRIGGADETIPRRALSVMTFNSRGFNMYRWIHSPGVERDIIDFLEQEKPDILCIQEFRRIYEEDIKGYTYHYATPSSRERTTQAIFSKYPIVKKGSLDFPGSNNNALFADVLYRGDTLRVYNIHLQSYRVIPSRRMFRYLTSGWFYKRFTTAFKKQQEQAFLVRQHMEQSPHPVILCGDFNNTQFSRAYQVVKGEMNDSYLTQGSGFGTTYLLKFLPLRIDAILSDPSLTVESHKNYTRRLSDHYPVMASFSIEERDNGNP